MLDTKYTEHQYAFELLDFAAEKGRLKFGDPYFIEARKELIELVNSQTNSARFWHDRWLDMCEAVMMLAGLPVDFKEHGTGEAFQLLRDKLEGR